MKNISKIKPTFALDDYKKLVQKNKKYDQCWTDTIIDVEIGDDDFDEQTNKLAEYLSKEIIKRFKYAVECTDVDKCTEFSISWNYDLGGKLEILSFFVEQDKNDHDEQIVDPKFNIIAKKILNYFPGFDSKITLRTFGDKEFQNSLTLILK